MSYDSIVGLDENLVSVRSKNPCNNVPCCEACRWMNQYQFEMYNRIRCTKPICSLTDEDCVNHYDGHKDCINCHIWKRIVGGKEGDNHV